MDHYLFTARSVTHAQQLQQTLERGGLYVKVRRSGSGVSRQGCGYTLEIPERQYDRAMALLAEAGRHPVRVFHVAGGRPKEVSP